MDQEACIHGHTVGRFADGRCKECCRLASAAYQAKNSERVREQKRAYAETNRERQRARHAEWRARNQERIKAARRTYHERHRERIISKVDAWRAANPDKLRENGATAAHARRARKAQTGGVVTAADRREILRLQAGKCAYCRAPLTKKGRHFDHIVPLARGGANERRNVQALCPTCNLRKGAKDPIQFARSTGRLL